MYKIFIPLLILTVFAVPAFAQTPDEAQQFQKATNGDSTLEKVEIEASFTGGEQAWQTFLEKNLDPATPVINGAPPGRYTVNIQFIVERNGQLSAFKALTKHGFGMEAEVIRILRKSPPWNPATQNGRAVRVYRVQPVMFQVTEEKGKKKRRRDPD